MSMIHTLAITFPLVGVTGFALRGDRFIPDDYLLTDSFLMVTFPALHFLVSARQRKSALRTMVEGQSLPRSCTMASCTVRRIGRCELISMSILMTRLATHAYAAILHNHLPGDTCRLVASFARDVDMSARQREPCRCMIKALRLPNTRCMAGGATQFGHAW